MSWIKIDLHVHSEDSSYTGSNISKESDIDKLLILQKNRVIISCFADHDKFYLDSYLKRLEIINKEMINLTIWPGIEVNLKKYNGQKGQAIFIFNPNSDLKKLQTLTENEFRFYKKLYSYKEAIHLFEQEGFNFMVFPHAGKAQDNMSYEDIKDCKVTGLDVTDYNNRNKKDIVRQMPNVPILYFSDTHTWKKYPQYGKYCSYVEVENKNNLTFQEIKNNIENNKVSSETL
ncbi:hypothetical protein [Mycoplasma elephantis]|uniref:hypothetical protein n=1 Tax=Mycoplasma elephantis TaxID=114882 RepID=UPI0004847B93|nr:hypothetical protein [Mycoplasma elephantis]